MKDMLRQKIIFSVSLLLELLCILAACSTKERHIDKNEAEQSSVTERADEPQKADTSKEQVQSALELELDRLREEYDKVTLWEWAPYGTLARTDGVRPGLVQEVDGTRHIGEIPDTKVWILLKDGTLLSDEPFDACIDYMATPEGEVYCIRNGTGYRYTVSAEDGSFRLSQVEETGVLEEDHFGFRLSVYRWESREPCYGIVAADGAEVIAPVYERVEIPFPDRFLIFEGGASQGPIMGRCRLTDEAGNTLCLRFHWIDYSVFDGSYVGIAVCYGERAAYLCYDEAGAVMPEGYWLVDRDGNPYSERFAKLSFGEGDETHVQSERDVLHIQYADGTEGCLPPCRVRTSVGCCGAVAVPRVVCFQRSKYQSQNQLQASAAVNHLSVPNGGGYSEIFYPFSMIQTLVCEPFSRKSPNWLRLAAWNYFNR